MHIHKSKPWSLSTSTTDFREGHIFRNVFEIFFAILANKAILKASYNYTWKYVLAHDNGN